MKTLEILENDIEIAHYNVKYYSKIRNNFMLNLWQQEKEKLIMDLVCNY